MIRSTLIGFLAGSALFSIPIFVDGGDELTSAYQIPFVSKPADNTIDGWEKHFIQAKVPRFAFQQNWAKEPTVDLPGGEVRVGWNGSSIVVLAKLEEDQPGNPVRGFNEPAFTEGDVFEFFIQPGSTGPYLEIHVTPENSLTQLYIPSVKEIRQPLGDRTIKEFLTPFLLPPPAFSSLTQIAPDRGSWKVLLRIPANRLPGDVSLKPGFPFSFMAARYDYPVQEGKILLSATAPLTVLSFHRPWEWHRAMLE